MDMNRKDVPDRIATFPNMDVVKMVSRLPEVTIIEDVDHEDAKNRHTVAVQMVCHMHKGVTMPVVV